MALQYWRLQPHKLWQILPRQKDFQTPLGWCIDYYGMWFCCNATIHPAGISLFCLRLTTCKISNQQISWWEDAEIWYIRALMIRMVMTRTSSGRPWPMPAKAENMSGAPFPRAMIVTPAMFWDNLTKKLLPLNPILSKRPEGLWDDFDGGAEIVVCSNSQADEKHHKPDDIQNHLGQWTINWVYHFWSPSYDISRNTVMW